MIVEFYTDDLFNLYTGNFIGKQKYPHEIIKRFKDKVDVFYVAENINVLSNIKGLNIEKYKEHWSARINKQFRIEFEFIKPKTILILNISKHYE